MNGFRKLLVPIALLFPFAAHAFDVDAKSAIVIDAQTGKILWQKDADTPRYPASTTKIMTALLLLEHTKPTDVITAPADIEKVKEASMHLKPGEKVTAHDMLYALMLRSANDGCYAVAVHIAGSVEKFADMMNARAREIGCTNTHFHNPNGLNDTEHWTSAHDLALIGREAMKNPEFREVVRTYRYEIQRSINQKDRIMVSHNRWLPKDITADGIKTGYTVPAGHCYVGSATRNGYRVITVVMNSPHWQKDHQEMLSWAFGEHERMPLLQKGIAFDQAPVQGGAKDKVKVSVGETLDSLVSKSALVGGHASPLTRVLLDPALKAPIQKGQVVGSVIVQDPEGFEQRAPLVAEEDVPQTTLAAVRGGSKGEAAAFGVALVAGTVLVRGRARRSRTRGTQAIRTRLF